MTAALTLHEITGSPNNVKIRIALGYKGLSYTRKPIKMDSFPGDRSELIALSRQPRTPVLQHGDTVMFDSHAILRYLDANFHDTPSLFSEDYQEMGEIEEWELWNRTELGQPIGMVFGQAMSESPDTEVCRKASALLNELTGRIEKQLEETGYLVAGKLTAADINVAPAVNLAMITEAATDVSPIAGFFRENLHLGDGRERTRAWVEKLMAHDEVHAG